MSEYKYVTADQAVTSVRTGDHIHLSSIASVPHVLIRAVPEGRCGGGERPSCPSFPYGGAGAVQF